MQHERIGVAAQFGHDEGDALRVSQITAADKFAASLPPIVNAIKATGATSLEAITRALNDRGIRSAREQLGMFHR